MRLYGQFKIVNKAVRIVSVAVAETEYTYYYCSVYSLLFATIESNQTYVHMWSASRKFAAHKLKIKQSNWSRRNHNELGIHFGQMK